MTSLILATSPLKIRSWISGELSMISIDAMRPEPDSRGIRRCEIRRADVQRQVHQQLLAPLVREEVDDAIERLVGAVRVQRRQHQVSGLGELNAVLHRLAVADLTDQDDIGRLAQGVLQRGVPGIGVHADLAMRDDAALVLVDVLDRILDRYDVAARLLVAVADHRGQRGGFARAGAARRGSPGRAWTARPPSGWAAGRAPRSSGSWR